MGKIKTGGYPSIRKMLFTAALMLLAGTCTPAAAAPVRVFVSILPQKQMVQRIGGDRVAVAVMVPPGAEPHTYEPKPAQMAALAKTRIYFSVGASFEYVWLPRFAAINRHMKIVATDRGIQKMPLTPDGHADASQEKDLERLDPHTWLSPPLIEVMADRIHAALVRADPANTEQYDRRYANFLHELDALNQRIQRLLADKRGARFMVFHPSWGYFARTYGLVQVPIEIEGRNPKPAQLRHLIREARAWDIRVVFVQPEFSTRGARLIAEAIGARVIPADPLAADSLEQLLRLAEAINANTPEKAQ